MSHLLKDSNAFTVSKVIQEYEFRCLELVIINDANGIEIKHSIKNRNTSYDDFELSELLL